MMPISGGHSIDRERGAVGRQPDTTRRRWAHVARNCSCDRRALLIKGLFPASMARTRRRTPSMWAPWLVDGIVLEHCSRFPGECRCTALPCRRRRQRVGGLAIGSRCWHARLGGGALTGAVMNPARAFGPAPGVVGLARSSGLLDRTAARAAAGGALWKYLLLRAARRT